MSGALVVGAAPAGGHAALAFYRRLLAGAAAVVAADAAGEWCVGLGRVPELVVGDFDSSAAGARERLEAAGVRIEAHPAAKDSSDLDLAVSAALRAFGPPVVVTAAFSDRLDHTLASLGSLMRSGRGAHAEEPRWSAWPVWPTLPIVLDLEEGRLVSLLSPMGAAGVTLRGARWELDDDMLPPLADRGVSNEALGGTLTVSCASGGLLVFVSATEER
jgi:thiamine pyrophosphokinase